MLKKILVIAFVSVAALSGGFAGYIQSNSVSSVAADIKDIQKITSNQLLPKVQSYSQASDTVQKAQLLQEAVDASRERKEKMLDLMSKDPVAALNISMPDVQREVLPEEVKTLVEQPTTIEDKLSVAVTDDFEGNTTLTEYGVGGGEESVQLHLAEPNVDVLTDAADTTVRVSGVKLENHMAVPASGNPMPVVTADAGGTSAAASSATADAAPLTMNGTGTKKVAVIAVTFPDKPSLDFTMDQVRQEMFGATNSAKSYLKEMSYGKLDITGSVFGPYRVPMNGPDRACSWEDREKWLASAKSAAQKAGVNFSGYTNYVVVAAKGSKCSGSGTGLVPGDKVFMNGPWTNWYTVFGHELGHNLGLHHSSGLVCTSSGKRVTLSNSCTSDEYADDNSMMGYNYTHRHITASQKGQLAYLPPANTKTITADGTYLLVPSDRALSGLQSIRMRLKTAKTISNSQGGTLNYPLYYFEYRQPYGFNDYAANDPYVKGVTVRIGHEYNKIAHTQLLDMTPETATFKDAPLAAGKSYKFPDGYTVKVVSVNASGATIQVSGLGGAKDTTAPSAPTLGGSALSPTSVALNWTASTDNVGVDGYDIYRNDAKVATVSGSTRAFTNTGLSAGTSYRFTVKARDAAGNIGTSNTVTIITQRVNGPDTTPPNDAPSAPGSLKVTGTTTSQVNLSWTASTDNTKVAGYEITRNGTKVGSSTGTSFGDGGLTAATTYSYSVIAYDDQGNRSAAASITATTTAPTAATGALAGYVHTYTNPRPISGATITLYKAVNNSFYRSAVTNDKGTFAFANLPAEQYNMEVRYNGNLIIKRLVTINANKTSNWDIWIY